MRAVIQRVTASAVSTGEIKNEIGRGFNVLLGIGREDTAADADYICDKISGLRVFEDKDGKMNLSLADVGGEILLISQFTLYGDARRGRRPSFIAAASFADGEELYNYAIKKLSASYTVKTGVYGADMRVYIENDGPVTILLDSQKLF